MSKEMAIILLGVWVIIVPYLGIPSAWRTALLVLAGAGLLVIGFLMRSEALGRRSRSHNPRAGTSFVENTPERQTEVSIMTEEYSAHESQEGITSF